MGCSTTLYAVDLDTLRAAIGSRDADLLRRLRPTKKSSKAGKKDPERDGPRVKLTRQGEIILNGQPVTFEELSAALGRPEWKDTYLRSYIEDTPRAGRWRKPGSFPMAMTLACPLGHFLGTICCDSDEDLAPGSVGDDEISEKEATAELVEGRVSRPEEAHQYGYGLERLCRLLGKRLATIEGKGGMLHALALDTPLSAGRSPVPLPERDDFPDIGHLTADEVECEAARLGVLDLSYPQCAEIEEDRRTLLRCLRRAAKKRMAVVSFYY
jgi:hypothetical protein